MARYGLRKFAIVSNHNSGLYIGSSKKKKDLVQLGKSKDAHWFNNKKDALNFIDNNNLHNVSVVEKVRNYDI